MSDLGKRMFFVIGAPRSGTTLLMRMLNVHPEIATRPEPHLITPLAHLGYYAHVDKAPYDPFQAHEAAKAFVSELPNGEADYLDALRAYADTLYGRMLEPTGKRYFLDKTPAYALVLPFLVKLYPDAVFVVLTRHPFAIFSSYAKSFFDDDWDAALRFNPVLERYVPAMARFLRDRPVKRLVHVPYEELVTNPETHLRRICEAADLPYLPEMIDYGEKAVEGKGLGDPIGVKEHSRPTTASIHKWAKGVAGNDGRMNLLERSIALVPEEDLAVWGYSRESLWEPIQQVAPEAAAKAQEKQKKRWDRHHLERRALVVVRRDIHRSLLGRMLKRARFFLDVLLRE
ncbi:MAG: sulfotransferase [Deltaproteobacteria bacterium]|nr:sulfotransferase [Deltaproteobacteria bacterium]